MYSIVHSLNKNVTTGPIAPGRMYSVVFSLNKGVTTGSIAGMCLITSAGANTVVYTIAGLKPHRAPYKCGLFGYIDTLILNLDGQPSTLN